MEEEAARLEAAVEKALDDGLRTADLAGAGADTAGTAEVTAAVLAAL